MEHMTAKMSCFLRAYHYKEKSCPVFADTAAEKLLGEDYEKIADSLNAAEMTERFFAAYNDQNAARPLHAPEGAGYLLSVLR